MIQLAKNSTKAKILANVEKWGSKVDNILAKSNNVIGKFGEKLLDTRIPVGIRKEAVAFAGGMGTMPTFSVESKTLRDLMHFTSKHADDVVRGVGGSGKATATFKGELTAENITKELLQTKPKNSPTPQKWMDKGGEIEILEDGTWAYTNSEGITIKYVDGFPDFKNGIPPQVKKEFVIEGGFEGRSKDFSKAGDAGIGNTWHHHQDGKTLQAVDRAMHRQFTHRGGISIMKGNK